MSKPKTIPGQFVPHRLEMLQSPAWRSLSGTAKRVLERLEIEHILHAGQKNGRLICTYNDFAEHGIRRKSVAPAKRQLCATGFLEITQRGRRSADHGEPARHRLTYLPTQNSGPSDEWRDIDAPQTLTQSTLRRRNALAQKGQKLGAKTPPCQGRKRPQYGGRKRPYRSKKPRGRNALHRKPDLLSSTALSQPAMSPEKRQ